MTLSLLTHFDILYSALTLVFYSIINYLRFGTESTQANQPFIVIVCLYKLTITLLIFNIQLLTVQIPVQSINVP